LVHYVGRFSNGEDVRFLRVARPSGVFPAEPGDQGLDGGAAADERGRKVRARDPADLAYGTGRGPIPNGATLFFKVELIAINPPEAA
jgi:FKBP-type peptidyl-prolyl cis-trans isomerase